MLGRNCWILVEKFTQLSERLKPVMDSELQEIIREEK